jgi:hypothetical protein
VKTNLQIFFTAQERSMKRFIVTAILLVFAALTFTGCGGGNSSSSNGGSGTSQFQTFVTGEDAPLPSVVSFYITINSLSVSGRAANNTPITANLISQPVTVDFGRLMGMRSMLGFNSVPAGTYTSATFTFSNPVIYFVDVTTNPPAMNSINGTLANSTVTVAFPNGKPLTAGNDGLAGLHMDFDLRQSLAVDGTGQITGSVNPTVDVMSVSASDDLGQITDFNGSVLSTSANTFTMQGPYGFQEVIDVTPQTLFNGTYTLASLPTNAIVSVEGTVEADGSIQAADVEVVTTDKAFISGRILAVNPGPTVTMFVGEELPNLSPTIPVDSVYTVNLSAVTEYDVCFFDNWFTQTLFNNSLLVVGQRIFVGGTYQNGTFTPSMVSLRRQGVVDALVPNSVSITNGNQGSFQMQNDLLLSYSAGGAFTVETGNATNFINVNGLAGLQSAGTANLVARGLVFKDSTTGKPVVWAHRVRILP